MAFHDTEVMIIPTDLGLTCYPPVSSVILVKQLEAVGCTWFAEPGEPVEGWGSLAR